MKMRRIYILAVVLLIVGMLILPGCQKKEELKKYTAYYFEYFDTVTTIVGYAESEEEFHRICDDIERQLKEYHQLFNIYECYSNVVNLKSLNEATELQRADMQVDSQVIELLLFGKEMYRLTDGKINMAMGSVLSIWHDQRTKGMEKPSQAKLPSMEQLQEAATHMDIDQIQIDESRNYVNWSDPALKLDAGALGKGYAVEQIAKNLDEKEVNGYVLNVGGNVRTIGARPQGENWTIGIENPGVSGNEAECIAYLKLKGEAVVTSGAYQRYYEVAGIKYHHIIDPDTLMPGKDFLSVSIICEDSGIGDALSTALFSMSLEEGSELIESIRGTEAMWVTNDGITHYSSGFAKYLVE